MRLVLEPNAGGLEHAAPLDIDAFMAVDQDVVDGVILEQWLQRAEALHLVEDFRYEIVQFLGIERQPLGQDILRDHFLNVVADLLGRQFFQRRQIDFLDQTPMQPHLGVEKFFAQ